jgi:F0F1-type ATP synthase assembly protein I
VVDQRDDRSPFALAMEWSVQIMTIALEMVVPILIGAWIDGRLGTKGIIATAGGVAGMTLGIWSLLRLVKPLSNSRNQKPDRNEHPREPRL